MDNFPSVWTGASFGAWINLLRRNGFAVRRRFHTFVLITLATIRNTLLGYIQDTIFANHLRRCEDPIAPLFIIGHWRTGTTLLHELLTLDEQFTYPNMYQCFSPNHFLLTERLGKWMLTRHIPSQRPMDNMSIGWNSPQEDEFALCNLGQPSPYLTIAFPNQAPQCTEFFDLQAVPAFKKEAWKNELHLFLTRVTLANPGRLVLKSPTHTYRIKTLLELFPHAQFIHIVRNPYIVYPSTLHMWKTLYDSWALQRPTYQNLDTYVFDNFVHLYRELDKARPLLDASRYCEIRYEDLICDPKGHLRRIYEQLQLGDFERVSKTVDQYLADRSVYQTNQYELSGSIRESISTKWGSIIDRYGYGPRDHAEPFLSGM